MSYHPDFSHGLGHAADQQALLASCLELGFQERLQERQAKAQVSGQVAVAAMVPVPRSSEEFDVADITERTPRANW